MAQKQSAAKTSLTKLLPQAKLVACETWFLKTLHTSDQWTLGKSFVGFRCRIEVDFAILFTSKENVPRRDSAAPRGPTRGGSGHTSYLSQAPQAVPV